MLNRYHPWVLQALPPMTRQQAANRLEQMAARDANSRFVQRLPNVMLARLLGAAGGLNHLWRTLPTHYVSDLDGDIWQATEVTLSRHAGDCEDWSIALAAELKAIGLDARLGVMPGHAAVFVRLSPSTLWTPRSAVTPATWTTIVHKGELWLPLETTVAPGQRGQPGDHTAYIRQFVGTGELCIAGT